MVINDCEIEQVHKAKLLGVMLSDELNWNDHVKYLVGKASKRLYSLKLLKRAGVRQDALVNYFCSSVRSVLEYSCQLWSTSLTGEQSEALEQIQRRALKIICPGLDYESAIEATSLKLLSVRRVDLCKKFFLSVVRDDTNVLFKHLNRRASPYPTRNQTKFSLPLVKTKRFKSSFMVHGLYSWQ